MHKYLLVHVNIFAAENSPKPMHRFLQFQEGLLYAGDFFTLPEKIYIVSINMLADMCGDERTEHMIVLRMSE